MGIFLEDLGHSWDSDTSRLRLNLQFICIEIRNQTYDSLYPVVFSCSNIHLRTRSSGQFVHCVCRSSDVVSPGSSIQTYLALAQHDGNTGGEVTAIWDSITRTSPMWSIKLQLKLPMWPSKRGVILTVNHNAQEPNLRTNISNILCMPSFALQLTDVFWT